MCVCVCAYLPRSKFSRLSTDSVWDYFRTVGFQNKTQKHRRWRHSLELPRLRQLVGINEDVSL